MLNGGQEISKSVFKDFRIIIILIRNLCLTFKCGARIIIGLKVGYTKNHIDKR